MQVRTVFVVYTRKGKVRNGNVFEVYAFLTGFEVAVFIGVFVGLV